MKPLPLGSQLELFEAKLEQAWWSTSRGLAVRRDACICGLGLCGLRWVEIARMRRGDLQRIEAVLNVRTAKNGVPRRLPIGHSLTEGLIKLWHDQRRLEWASDWKAGAAFVTHNSNAVRYESVLRRVRVWTKQTFGQAYTVHCLRHTAAVRCHQATRDVLAVQRLLGHRSLQWTTVYLASLEVVHEEGLPAFVNGRPGKRPLVKLFDPENLICKGA